ncbi:MAG: ornithine carbamoyltransferase [Acidimicrobiia bacterium]
MIPTRHLLEIDDLTPGELVRVLDLCDRPLAADAAVTGELAGRSVGLYFEKPSLRTRHSSEAAVARLGGHPVTFSDTEVGIGTREPAGDIAKVLAGFHCALGARVFEHRILDELAAASPVPVINLLSDLGHPCQALADLKTMRDELGALAGRTVCWVGDYNNVARSLTLGAAMCGMDIRIASPVGYGPTGVDVERLRLAGLETAPFVTTHPEEAAEGADAVHTDVWASMGQEEEAEARRRAFEGFQVDDRVMAAAGDQAIFMHCLPAHRGEEVAESVADGPRSRMYVQAHNRMHAMIGLFRWLVEVEAIR